MSKAGLESSVRLWRSPEIPKSLESTPLVSRKSEGSARRPDCRPEGHPHTSLLGQPGGKHGLISNKVVLFSPIRFKLEKLRSRKETPAQRLDEFVESGSKRETLATLVAHLREDRAIGGPASFEKILSPQLFRDSQTRNVE